MLKRNISKSTVILLLLIISCNSRKYKKNKVIKDSFSYVFKCPQNPQGLIVLFPKFYNNINKTDLETGIDEYFFNKGYASLIVGFNSEFFLNENDFNKIYYLIEKIITVNKINEKKIIIGGFSNGGSISLNYSIWTNKLKKKIMPNSIFVGDSPVDFEYFYTNKNKVINKDYNSRAVNEASFIVKYLDEKLGNPIKNINNYYLNSPYTHSNVEKSNLKYLKNFNIIFFSEPDLEWFKSKIGYGTEDMNYFYIQKFQKKLKELSSKNIEFIKTKDKGFINNEKHPHSWTIIDPKTLFDWALKNFNHNISDKVESEKPEKE